MARETRIINNLITTAERSNMFNRHGAGLVSGGKIYAHGRNVLRNCVNGGYVTSVHAEIDVIRTSLNLGIIPSGDMWIIQYKRTGTLGKSMPCESCLETIKKYNIYRIFYSNDDGTITMVKTADAVSNWQSGAQRNYGTYKVILN
jgi:deoxycytidylate deaminase